MFGKAFWFIFIFLAVTGSSVFVYKYISQRYIVADNLKNCCEECQKNAEGEIGEKTCLESTNISRACEFYFNADSVKENECANQKSGEDLVDITPPEVGIITIPTQFKNRVWAGSIKVDMEGDIQNPGIPSSAGCFAFRSYSVHETFEFSELKVDTEQFLWKEKAEDLKIFNNAPKNAISVIGTATRTIANPFLFSTQCGTPVVNVTNAQEIEFNGYLDPETNTLYPFEYFRNKPMTTNSLTDCTLVVLQMGGCTTFDGGSTELKPSAISFKGFSFEIVNNSLEVVEAIWQGPPVFNVATGQFELLPNKVPTTITGILNVVN